VAVDLLLFAWIVADGIVRRSRVARSRRQLEDLAGVLFLPSVMVIRRRRARKAVGGLIFASLVLAFSLRLAVVPARTEAADARSTNQDRTTGTALNHASDQSIASTPATPSRGFASLPISTPSLTTSPQDSTPSEHTRPPSTVAAVPTSSTTIHLEWAPVTDASTYDIERSVDAIEWDAVASQAGDQTTYTDASLSSGTTYYYRVVAFVEGERSAPSDAVSASTAVDTSIPPVLLSATGRATSIDLTWSRVDGARGYHIERSADGKSGWVAIGTTGQDVSSFTDAGLAPATVYYYRVIAERADGESPPSAAISATTPADKPTPSQAADHEASGRPSGHP
jgi:hypothetical protein